MLDTFTSVGYFTVVEAQPQILTTLRSELPRLEALLKEQDDPGRNATARRVCQEFGFIDPRGHPRQAGCLKALRTLDAEKQIILPAGQECAAIAKPRLLDAPVAKAKDVPDTARKVKDLRIIQVKSRQDRAIWNTLMDQEHPRGAAIFAGAQVKYLIHSAHGYLRAGGFSSAALYLHVRDRFIFWDQKHRAAQLHRMVNLSRFLIRPDIRCKNLTSYVLSRVLRRLPRDFRARYGYAPYLVETFVSPDQKGTFFKAADFRYSGQTKGRGRHATTHACTRSKKKVLIYELDPRWRAKLGVPHVELRPRLEVGRGLNADQWAQQEFAEAELGDLRRSRRLVSIVYLLSTLMGRPATASPKRDLNGMAAYYRFLEKADKCGITPEKVLAPHRERTVERMRTQETVLCIPDGTDISYSTRPECEGVEVIGRNQTTCEAKGVHLHATLAINDEGLPLGVLRCAYRKKEGQTKTDQWIDGLLDIDEAAQTLPRKTRVLSVMDREADAYAILAAQQRCTRTDIVVRAKHDRNLKGKGEQRLFKAMRKGTAAGHMLMSISRLSHRTKSGRVTSAGRVARNARLAVRYRKAILPPTKDKTAKPVRVWGIHVREVAPPRNAEAIEWYLLTTAEVSSLAEAEEIIKFYCLRWRVEDIFRVLKTGCKVEQLQMQQANRLHLVITLYMVTAWRIMLMTLLGRIEPGLPADIIFTDMELLALGVYARNYNLPDYTDLASAVHLMAMIGGYLNRKHDPPPGHEIMWRGYTDLQIRAIAFEELVVYNRMRWPRPP